MSQIPMTGSKYAREFRRSTAKSYRSAIALHYRKNAMVWALRLLVRLDGYKRFQRVAIEEDVFFKEAGIQPLERGHTDTDLKLAFKNRLLELETNLPKGMGALTNNIELLGNALGLDSVERNILGFVLVLHNVRWLEHSADTLGSLDSQQAHQAIATALVIDESDIRTALGQNSTLISSGIIRCNIESVDLKCKLKPLDILKDIFFVEHKDASELLKPFFHEPPAPLLSRADYAHATADWNLVAEYLKSVSAKGQPGVNILIHGQPGTGKTEFARAIASDIGLTLCEVVTEDLNGNPLDTPQRYGAYLFAQKVLQRMTGHVILLDEIEDIFPFDGAGIFGLRTRSSSVVSKASTNRTLETNQVPCFWLSNHIEQIDPAYLRRFDVIVEMRSPPRSARKRLLQRYLDGIPVSDKWVGRISEHSQLTPAAIERAAKVVKFLNPKSPSDAENKLAQVLQGSLEAMGHMAMFKQYSTDTLEYKPEYLNPDTSIDSICNGLRKSKEGIRLCFYGPPGTGKSATAIYLAELIDRPLIVKRASDILSPFLGISEKNIASMFREAEGDDGLLVLEEADSFLRDRNYAHQSWEISQVNEFLTQMESFNGVFIASTNLIENIDAASLRRFDYKVRFGYMRPEQSIALFKQVTGDSAELSDAIARRVRALENVTPGDFAVAKRQSALQQDNLPAEVLADILEKESRMKSHNTYKFLGFSANTN